MRSRSLSPVAEDELKLNFEGRQKEGEPAAKGRRHPAVFNQLRDTGGEAW